MCKNAHITRGGEIEKRKKFVEKYSLPAGETFGLKVFSAGVYVFGSVATSAVPAGVTYQRLQHPLSLSMTALLDATVFDGKVYAIAQYSDDSVHHFYDGARVTAWDDGVVTDWYPTLDDVASRIADLINADATATATASAAGSVITITGKTVDVALNITAEAINVTGGTDDQTATVVITQADDATHVEITTVTLAGTVDTGDRYAVTISSVEYGAGANPSTKGTLAFTHRSKVYSPAGQIVYFSAVDDATVWRSDVDGAGFINTSTRSEGSLNVVGVGKYQGNLAFFSDNLVQIWTLDEDPLRNVLVDTIENSGAVAGKSVQAYGNQDTFYLSRSGLRSLRARNTSDSAFVSDVGNAIDSLLISQMRTLGAVTTAAAVSVIEPIDGRYWLALGSTIYVLSHFPGAKVTGWSWYEPGFTVEAFSAFQGSVYARSGDTIYLYGGDDGVTYDTDASDNYEVEVSLPFLAGKRVADDKTITAYDLAVTGTWLVELLVDPRNESRKVTLGTISETTYPAKVHAASAEGTHFAPRMVCTTPGAATITNLALHLEEDEDEVTA